MGSQLEVVCFSLNKERQTGVAEVTATVRFSLAKNSPPNIHCNASKQLEANLSCDWLSEGRPGWAAAVKRLVCLPNIHQRPRLETIATSQRLLLEPRRHGMSPTERTVRTGGFSFVGSSSNRIISSKTLLTKKRFTHRFHYKFLL